MPRIKKCKSFVACTRAIKSPTYRSRVRRSYRQALGEAYNNSLNDERRAILAECIWKQEDDLEQSVCREPWSHPMNPTIEAMRTLRNDLYDDLGWQGKGV
jgi:hypothetical protein